MNLSVRGTRHYGIWYEDWQRSHQFCEPTNQQTTTECEIFTDDPDPKSFQASRKVRWVR